MADPFTRLRVPKYQKAFQVLFFISFLLLYYAVLVERNPKHITVTEVFLYLWIAAYAYDEFGEFLDAGFKFYQTDFWSLWDLAIIFIGAAFLITSKHTRFQCPSRIGAHKLKLVLTICSFSGTIGLLKGSDYIIDVSFDVLSMAALFLVPRICSVMSLNPYFGSLASFVVPPY